MEDMGGEGDGYTRGGRRREEGGIEKEREEEGSRKGRKRDGEGEGRREREGMEKESRGRIEEG